VGEPRVAIVTGLAAGDGERSAGEFFEAFAAARPDLDLEALPASEAFGLLFDDDPLP